MQRAANSSVLPILLEQIFQRFSSSDSEDKEENLLLDLHKLLGGRLVPAALHILDNQTIVISTNNQKTVEVAEICDNRSLRLIRLILHFNYCTCDYFKRRVLIKEAFCTGPYICQHILAVRLAFVLQHECLKFKEIPTHSLNLFLTSFINTNSEIE